MSTPLPPAPHKSKKMAFFEVETWEEEDILKRFPSDQVFILEDRLEPDRLPQTKDLEVISIFVNSRIDESVINYFPNLRLIATRSTGYDHIDVAAARAAGVEVAYVPGYGDNTVAEFAFGLMLNLTRKIYWAVDQIKETENFSRENLRGMDLKDKTLGVIGTGRIGKQVMKIAHGFDMKILAYDLVPDVAYAKSQGAEYTELDTLLGRSDIITLHCPYNPSTHHLISLSSMLKIKPGAILINTARGALVETQALLMGLEKGIIAGAGLDVLEEEAEMSDELHFLKKEHTQEEDLRVMLQNHVLLRHPKVIITPHNAFNSKEALARILNTTLDNIDAYINNKPTNLVAK